MSLILFCSFDLKFLSMVYFDHLHLCRNFCKNNIIHTKCLLCNWQVQDSTIGRPGWIQMTFHRKWGPANDPRPTLLIAEENIYLRAGQIIVQILVPLLTSFVTVDNLLKLSEPQVSYLWNGGDIHLQKLLWGLNNFCKSPTTYLAHNRCSVIDSSSFPYSLIQNDLSVFSLEQFSPTG